MSSTKHGLLYATRAQLSRSDDIVGFLSVLHVSTFGGCPYAAPFSRVHTIVI